MGAVSAGLSVVNGIAGISAKNSSARAQRQQLRAQAEQQAQQQANQEAILAQQQVFARQQFEMDTLSRLATYQASRVGLSAQQAQANLEAQQQRHALQVQQASATLQAGQAQQQLERQAAAVTLQADQSIGGALTKESEVNSQLSQAIVKATEQLTEQDRRRISQEVMGRLSSTSSRIGGEANDLRRVASVLAQGLALDEDSAMSALQSLGEQEAALIAERIGLNDASVSSRQVSDNLRLAMLNTQGSLDQVEADLGLVGGALDISSRQLDLNTDMTQQAASSAYRTQDYNLGLQRDLNRRTGETTQASLNSAMNSTRGAGFFDYLQTGYQAYGAVSPLLRRPPSRPSSTSSPLYSGFPTVYSNLG